MTIAHDLSGSTEKIRGQIIPPNKKSCWKTKPEKTKHLSSWACTHILLKNLAFLLKMGILQRELYAICKCTTVTKISVTLQECRKVGYAALFAQTLSRTTKHYAWFVGQACKLPKEDARLTPSHLHTLEKLSMVINTPTKKLHTVPALICW